MARRLRRPSESGIHHVMNRGAGHEDIFLTDADRLDFGRRLVWIHRELGVVVLAYCLMDNHFHLVLWAPPGVLPQAMKHLGQVFTQHLNRRIDSDGPVFRGRYVSIPVETDSYLATVVRYVHLNPIAIAGVDHPSQYRWSSFPPYADLAPVPVFLDVSPVMALHGGSTQALIDHTELGLHRGRPVPIVPAGGSLADVRQLVAWAFALDDLHHPDAHRATQNMDRTLLLLLAERTSEPSLRAAILDDLGPRSPDAERQAARRAEKRLATDPVLHRILVQVEAGLRDGTVHDGSDPS